MPILDAYEALKSVPRRISKLMVANRGEIAIRVFRACHEMGIRTMAVYSKEDTMQMHRYKADESYLVGSGLPPVAAYLDVKGLIKAAKLHNVDAIHPGYGFLSESSTFAKACEDNGIIWVGPKSSVVASMGDKTQARKLAQACGVNIVPGTPGPVDNFAEARRFCSQIGFPVILKAAHGGGGRGMRVVHNMNDLEENFNRATSEALTSFGDGSVFIERFVTTPRHIEVQILGDEEGNVVHLYERDCSVQRRHQKVVEVCPAPNLPPELRASLTRDAVKLAKHARYNNAGTVEFLVDPEGRYYFIEVNARLQVEHTVTEEVTGVDLVQSQILLASGATLPKMGITQERIELRGNAIQCRVTAEDPENNFAPHIGRINTFRTGEGMGIRLDGANGFAGAVVSPFYDSLLVKVTGRHATFQGAAKKLDRALGEFRVRGVKTNIPFLKNVLNHPTFLAGETHTGFIDKSPELFTFKKKLDRASKLLQFLANSTVNGAMTPLGTSLKPPRITVPEPASHIDEITNNRGLRQIFKSQGPKAFADAVRRHKGVLLTDTTFRDAHQSLLATRVRTVDLMRVAPATRYALAAALSLEVWGGATFDVALRFLRECPWDRLAELREKIPDIPFQMLLRGANAVGYTSYPDNVVYKFCDLAVKNGVDIFRVFDSLNYLPNLQLGMDAVGQAGGIIEASMCYTSDVLTNKKYNTEYYLKYARALVEHGAHILNIKDMAGLLKPRSAHHLVSELRKEFPNVPIHVHTHDTAGAGVASMLAAAWAGADAVDCAVDSMSGMTSQPSMGAIVAALEGTELDTGITLADIAPLNAYWESVRALYAPFECTTTMKSGNADVYIHEIPGGQYTNLHFQAHSLGLGHKFEEIKAAYAAANRICGDIIKVTPSSKVVGDLAQFMVQNHLTEAQVHARAQDLSFPESVVEYFQGLLGVPEGGFPEPIRTHVLRGKAPIEGRPGASMAPLDFEKLREKLQPTTKTDLRDVDLMSSVMYPKVFNEYLAFRDQFGKVSNVPTDVFFDGMVKGQTITVDLEEGKTLVVQLKAIGELEHPSGEREVFFELNGQPRSVFVVDQRALKTSNVVRRVKADAAFRGQVGAPMPGSIIAVKVKEGQTIEKGAPLLVLSAMKMETVVKSPVKGVVKRLVAAPGDDVAGEDLLLELTLTE